jgi:hypothetical protein
MRGVAGAVVVPHMVSGVLSSHHMGVAAAVVAPRGVLRGVLSHHVVPGPGGPSREWAAVYIGMKDLAAKEEVSKQKKMKEKREIILAVKQEGEPVQR